MVGLFCVFGAVSVNSGAPETAETIRNAVYVSDGKVLPENEGKVVIVPGTLDAAPYVDKETGCLIQADKIRREVTGNPVTSRQVYLQENPDDQSGLSCEYLKEGCL